MIGIDEIMDVPSALEVRSTRYPPEPSFLAMAAVCVACARGVVDLAPARVDLPHKGGAIADITEPALQIRRRMARRTEPAVVLRSAHRPASERPKGWWKWRT